MKIHEITNEAVTIPDEKQVTAILKLFKSPITVAIAKERIIPHFNTPLLVDLLKSIKKNKKTEDIRQSLVHYFDAEYPTISARLKTRPLLRDGDGDGDGELSPLGHKDEG